MFFSIKDLEIEQQRKKNQNTKQQVSQFWKVI